MELADALPMVPVPLRSIYEEAAYELSIDYGEVPPPPKLSEADMAWVEKLSLSEI